MVPSVARSRFSNSRCSSEPFPESCGLSSSGPAAPRSSLLSAFTGWLSSSPNKRPTHASSDNVDVRPCLRRISASFSRHEEYDLGAYLFPYGAALHLIRAAFIVLRGLLTVCLVLPPRVPACWRLMIESRASSAGLLLGSVNWDRVLAIRLLLARPS